MFKTKRNKKEEGQGLVEYALILVLVAIVVIAVLMLLGPIIGNVFSTINGSLSSFGGGEPLALNAPQEEPEENVPGQITFMCPSSGSIQMHVAGVPEMTTNYGCTPNQSHTQTCAVYYQPGIGATATYYETYYDADFNQVIGSNLGSCTLGDANNIP